MVDKNDALYLSKKKNLSIGESFGNLCLNETGKLLEVDEVVGGSIKNFGNKIVCAFRIIDVRSESAEKGEVIEFLPVWEEMPWMIQLTIQKLFNLPMYEIALRKLTKVEVIENEITNPTVSRLKLEGPRMGAIYLTDCTPEYSGRQITKGAIILFL